MLALFAPAKINLLLKTLFERPDGYCELRTVFQTIALADRIQFRPREDGEIRLAGEASGIALDETNLCNRAAVLLRESVGGRLGADIFLEKHIPAQSGLGGGSSDAAATLVGLNRLWATGLDAVELAELGRRLGADVPFFLTGGTALGVGRGDEVIALPDLPDRWVLLVFPEIAVSTPWAYRQLKLLLTKPEALNRIPRLRGFSARGDTWLAQAENDFEQVVFKEHPLLEKTRDRLREAGAQPAMMTGSGSAVFGIFESEAQCRQAARWWTESPGAPARLEVTRFLCFGEYRRQMLF